MSRKWYPVIDYEKCVECSACVDMCQHGVYDRARAPSPVVVFPDGCVEGCKGCGNRCPAEAIQYVGDGGAGNGKAGNGNAGNGNAGNGNACGCGCSGA